MWRYMASEILFLESFYGIKNIIILKSNQNIEKVFNLFI